MRNRRLTVALAALAALAALSFARAALSFARAPPAFLALELRAPNQVSDGNA